LGLLSFVSTGVHFWSQIPPLINDVASGVKRFSPPRDVVMRCVEEEYSVEKTLILQFDNDDTDESEELERVLGVGRCERVVIDGNHFTPVVGLKADDVLGKGVEIKLVREVVNIVDAIDKWIGGDDM